MSATAVTICILIGINIGYVGRILIGYLKKKREKREAASTAALKDVNTEAAGGDGETEDPALADQPMIFRPEALPPTGLISDQAAPGEPSGDAAAEKWWERRIEPEARKPATRKEGNRRGKPGVALDQHFLSDVDPSFRLLKPAAQQPQK